MKLTHANANHEPKARVPFRKALFAAGALAVLSSPFALNHAFAAKPPAVEKSANPAEPAKRVTIPENEPSALLSYGIFILGLGAILFKYRQKS